MGWVALSFRFRGCGDSSGDFSLASWVADARASSVDFGIVTTGGFIVDRIDPSGALVRVDALDIGQAVIRQACGDGFAGSAHAQGRRAVLHQHLAIGSNCVREHLAVPASGCHDIQDSHSFLEPEEVKNFGRLA